MPREGSISFHVHVILFFPQLIGAARFFINVPWSFFPTSTLVEGFTAFKIFQICLQLNNQGGGILKSWIGKKEFGNRCKSARRSSVCILRTVRNQQNAELQYVKRRTVLFSDLSTEDSVLINVAGAVNFLSTLRCRHLCTDNPERFSRAVYWSNVLICLARWLSKCLLHITEKRLLSLEVARLPVNHTALYVCALLLHNFGILVCQQLYQVLNSIGGSIIPVLQMRVSSAIFMSVY